MTTAHPPDPACTCSGALEELQTILGGFVGLGLLLRSQEEHLDAYQLAKVAMIIEVLTARFAVLLDTALDGMLALGRQAALRPAVAHPHAAEGEDA